MELIFVRHAAPAWVVDAKSVLNPRLSDIGTSQVQHLKDHLSSWSRPPDELWISPTARTQETATAFQEAFEMEGQTKPWLEEIRLPPEWEGSPATTIGEFFREASRRRASEWWEGIPGGETYRDFASRITRGLEAELASNGMELYPDEEEPGHFQAPTEDKRVVIVGHGGTNSTALAWLLGIEPVPWSWERFVMLHASLSRVRAHRMREGVIFGLRDHSNVAHLPRGLRSR